MLSRISVGTGTDLSIGELAEMIARVTGFSGKIDLDPTMPDGTPRKLLDTTRITRLGRQPSIPLEEGLRRTYAWFVEHGATVRG